MPNNCHNAMRVTGPHQALEDFADLAHGRYSAFQVNNFVPMPQEINAAPSPNRNEEQVNRLIRKYEASNWHDWAINNWGSKWPAYNTHLETQGASALLYTFDTAWTPFNAQVFLAMSRRFPELAIELHYFDQLMRFKGRRTLYGGKITHESQDSMTREEIDRYYDSLKDS